MSVAWAVALAAAAPAWAGVRLDFDVTFRGAKQPAQAHYVAMYRLADGEHRLEVWRDSDVRLKRHTDAGIETVVTKPAGDAEWAMVVLDLKRRIRTDVGRTNLMRIGHFTDWLALSRLLARPVGAYELTAIGHGAPRIETPGPCRWYRLAQGSRASRICWSEAQQLPFVITDDKVVVQWRVTAFDSRPLPPGTFAIDDRGFVRNDANRDILAD